MVCIGTRHEAQLLKHKCDMVTQSALKRGSKWAVSYLEVLLFLASVSYNLNFSFERKKKGFVMLKTKII